MPLYFTLHIQHASPKRLKATSKLYVKEENLKPKTRNTLTHVHFRALRRQCESHKALEAVCQPSVSRCVSLTYMRRFGCFYEYEKNVLM